MTTLLLSMLTSKLALHHRNQSCWFFQMDLLYSRFRAWCHSFQPMKDLYLCFVFFFLFSIIGDSQHQVSHSIITRNTDINTKQLSWSPAYPSVTKHFKCECLWCHAQASTQKQTLKTFITTIVMSLFYIIVVIITCFSCLSMTSQAFTL